MGRLRSFCSTIGASPQLGSVFLVIVYFLSFQRRLESIFFLCFVFNGLRDPWTAVTFVLAKVTKAAPHSQIHFPIKQNMTFLDYTLYSPSPVGTTGDGSNNAIHTGQFCYWKYEFARWVLETRKFKRQWGMGYNEVSLGKKLKTKCHIVTVSD